jgi:SET domain-containing protein
MFREPRNSFPRWFASDKIEVKKSDVHGLGCFATKSIAPRTLIESCPIIVFSVNSLNVLDHLGGRHILSEYPYRWLPGSSVICLGYGSLYNHSTNSPNATWKVNDELPSMEFYSMRLIEEGEEILVRYIPHRIKDRIWFADDDAHDGSHFSLDEVHHASQISRSRKK